MGDPAVIVIEEAKLLINNSDLPHPSPPLLMCFIHNAINPKLTASYIVDACRAISNHGQEPPGLDASLCAAITRRDDNRDCITGKRGTLRDPLVVRPILPVPSQWLTDDRMDPRRSHWLTRRSSASAFSEGLIMLRRLHPSMIEYEVHSTAIGTLKEIVEVNGLYPLLGDHSRSGQLKVDHRFVGTHARLSPSKRWLEVARHMSLSRKGHNTLSLTSTLANVFRIPSLLNMIKGIILSIFLPLWLIVPGRMRVTAYRGLQQVGLRLYGRLDGPTFVQRLPFGLYLKYQGPAEAYQNEFNALKTLLDGQIYNEGFLLTTRIQGRPISKRQTLFSDQDFTVYVAQMQDIITQLRSIPKPADFEFAICNTMKKHLILIYGHSDDPARRGHRIVLRHADFNAGNILGAGYYPEYWDYTKSLYEGFRFGDRCCCMTHNVFEVCGDLKRDYEAEVKSWRSGPW
ncbi:hypothetical protein F5B18DRAFT_660401 [Nemania serpens]|nr:hypothetical protein F5B18DRAFT_660401 [Nemania serpens]